MAFSFEALLDPVGVYTGVGSRSTPAEVLELMGDLAARLAGSGWRVRSGRARGADQAFERGAERALGDVEVYRPDGG
jgi:predicted Rossmann fold nucleotide-binding protein DprA/Smf involved in DNA uptake